MSKPKKSGAAIFMYCVIAVCLVITATCFSLYYGNIIHNDILFWTGITCFTIMYHLWMRIIMGNVSKLFKVNYTQWWFKEKSFEKKIHKILRTKKWKDKALTYNPEQFSFKEHSLENIANTMSKAELDHWINQLISLSTLLFALIWGQLWIFLITALLAMAFDGQFIVIQRYNRPRIVGLIKRQNAHQKAPQRFNPKRCF